MKKLCCLLVTVCLLSGMAVPALAAAAPAAGPRILVAYFSCTGHTEPVAQALSTALGADLYEIVPQEPYTTADLNYSDSSSRTTLEQNNPSARPAISGSAADMDSYDVVFLGYPIWWGQAPRIISTFLESYDFSKKTIVPFCTSASSGIGSSATNLHALVPDSVSWLPGARFPIGASASAVSAWADSLELPDGSLQIVPDAGRDCIVLRGQWASEGTRPLALTTADGKTVPAASATWSVVPDSSYGLGCVSVDAAGVLTVLRSGVCQVQASYGGMTASIPVVVPGDCSRDGRINLRDVTQGIDIALEDAQLDTAPYSLELLDLTCDGQINSSDVSLLIDLAVEDLSIA